MAKLWRNLILALPVLLPGLDANGEDSPCKYAVDGLLAELKVSEAEIKRVSIKPKEELTSTGTETVGVDAWVRLQSCSGALIIKLTEGCEVLETSLNGDCVFPDQRKF